MPADLVSLWPVAVGVCTAAAVYGGIRADLRRMQDSIQRAHARIDAHIDMHCASSQRPGA